MDIGTECAGALGRERIFRSTREQTGPLSSVVPKCPAEVSPLPLFSPPLARLIKKKAVDSNYQSLEWERRHHYQLYRNKNNDKGQLYANKLDNSEKWKNSWKDINYPEWLKKRENLNRPITRKELNYAFKNLIQKPRTRWFHWWILPNI